MSIKLMQMVIEQPRQALPKGQKLVMLILANYANDEGEAFPSVATLADNCSVDEATIFRNLNKLEDDEWLARHDFGNNRTLYVLNVEKLRQRDLLEGSQNASTRKMRGAALRELHPRKMRGEGSQNASSIKQPSANHQEPPPCEGSEGHGDQWPKLDKRQQQLVSNYQPIPSSLRLDVFCSYVDHRAVKRRELSGPAWMLVRKDLLAMEAGGVDLNESLELTIRRGLVDPVRPDTQKPATPRANDDLSGTVYGANDYSKLPAHLRPAADG
jgi:helix-turn-helix protein